MILIQEERGAQPIQRPHDCPVRLGPCDPVIVELNSGVTRLKGVNAAIEMIYESKDCFGGWHLFIRSIKVWLSAVALWSLSFR